MMIRALVEAGSVFGTDRHIRAAAEAADYIQRHLVDNRTDSLLRRIRGGEAGIDAGLVDYAWYINGLLALPEHTAQRIDLDGRRPTGLAHPRLRHRVTSAAKPGSDLGQQGLEFLICTIDLIDQ